MLASDPQFPCCSERCRMIDLGKWVSGGYVISSPLNDQESSDSNFSDDLVKK